jgi:hypothetical protein
MALDLNSKQIIQSFGISGHGPDDVIFPRFILSVDHTDVLLQDGFAMKFNKVYFNEQKNQFAVEKYMDYPIEIFRSGETNISENFIAGRQIGTGKLFYIYDRRSNIEKTIDYYPKVKGLSANLDLNYIYAPTIALNEEKNRILSGMYFFDMFHVYDLSGNRIKTCYFSKNFISSFDRKVSMANIGQKASVGLVRSFPTKDYCYFLRVRRDRTDNMLIQVNWDGDFINAYSFSDEIEGQFYIDEEERKLYIIRHRINPENYVEELFEVVSYSLK